MTNEGVNFVQRIQISYSPSQTNPFMEIKKAGRGVDGNGRKRMSLQ